MKKYIILVGLISNVLYSQKGPDERIIMKSPQSYAFEKYGNIPVNLHTGAIDFKIPVAGIHLNGVDIPVTLSYDSSGFYPHKKSDNAGTNWTVLAGGRVTRTVKRVPDEYAGNSTGPYLFDGYHFGYSKKYSGFLKGTTTTPSDNVSALNLTGTGTGNVNTIDWVMGPPDLAYETEPDIFNFNAPGISGKFIVGNDGKVLVESEDPNIKVDLDGMARYNTENFCAIDIVSTIVIIDGKGNKYTFGGDFSKYELTYTTNDILFQEGFKGFPIINSFSLAKIEQSDGKIINFNYYSPTFDFQFCHNPYLFLNSASYGLAVSLDSHLQQGSTFDAFYNCGGLSCYNEIQTVQNNQRYFSIMKKSVLTSIKSGDSEVKLNYKNLGYPIKHEYSSPNNFFINEWVVDNIETYYGANQIKKTQFTYQDFGGEFKRPFLTEVKNTKDNSKYTFNYYSSFNLPPYYTKAIDHWGYYNGNDSNLYIAPTDPSYNINTGDYNLVNTYRDPNGLYHNVALLQKATYPTGGYSTFEYEPHLYGKRIERNSASAFLPTLTNNGGPAGGARIRLIQNFSDNGVLSDEKEYRYTSDLNGTLSSGILMTWPRYMHGFKIGPANYQQTKLITTSSTVQSNSLDSYNVGYSKVYEITPGKGYTEHNFTSYETNPDTVGSDVTNMRRYSVNTQDPADSEIIPLNLMKNLDILPTDKSILRGKVLSQRFFKEGDINPIKTVEYEYTDNIEFNPSSLADNNNYVSVNQRVQFWIQGYKKYMNSSYIKKKTIKDYFNGTEVKAETEYFYDSTKNLNLSRELVRNSDNTETKTNYQYLTDIWHGLPNHAGSFIPPYAFMMNMFSKNMHSIPLVTTSYRNSAFLGRNQVLYNYDQSNVGILPKKFLSYTEDKIVASQTSIGLPDTNFATEELVYDSYDEKGNIQQYTTKDGVPTTIIWGYNKTLPVAKILGAKLSDIPASIITALVNASIADGQAPPMSDEAAFLNALELFRKDVSLSGYQVTTYSHDPLIGVRSITPPSGIREVYKYDSAGRLKEVRENSYSGNLLKEYNYNFKP